MNFYSDLTNIYSDLMNILNRETIEKSALQDAFFCISTVGNVGTYSGAFALLAAGNALV